MKQRRIKLIAAGFLILLFVYLVIPLDLQRFKNESTVVLDKNDELLRVFLNDDQQWHLTSPDSVQVPEKLEKSILIYEDRSFYFHPGINPWSLIRAVYLNVKSAKVVSGGSTITMQLARLSSNHSRNIGYKLLEMLQAIKLEIKFSKKKLLKMYVENAPYGGNIIGFRTAALKYFNREPENLTWSEAATLAVLPNAPGLISPGKKQERLKMKRDNLLLTLFNRKIIDAETLKLSKMEPIPDKIYKLTNSALHLSRRAKNNSQQNVIKTTIDKDIQLAVESILKQHSKHIYQLGIDNIAALVCDTQTGEIVSYCGSQDFWNSERNGQVDGVNASRSSGSTLKPFLYALCMDEGILLPATKLIDVPTFFGAFSPKNANKNYDGLVSAHNALVHSLNVPAVRLLYTYGLIRFYESLKAAGISTLFRQSDEYGLTLIIGGSEVTLFDLVQLYRGLGNYGRFGKIYWNEAEKPDGAIELLSEGASYLTLDMMQDVNRPGAEYYWRQYENQYPLAWKTGTSFGHRDAWAIGVNQEWTIGVWVGNFTGEGNPALGGARSAGPILFDIFDRLPKVESKVWFDKPDRLKRVTLCKQSGYLATGNCSETISEWAPQNMKPLSFCPYHKRKYLNEAETFAVCSQCWEEGKYHQESILEYPPAVAKYLRKRGQIVPEVIQHNLQCKQNRQEQKLEILYPTNGSIIYIPKDIGKIKQKVIIKIANRSPDSRIFWYLDQVYLKSTFGKEEFPLNIGRGDHTLYITDELGNDAEVSFKIISK